MPVFAPTLRKVVVNILGVSALTKEVAMEHLARAVVQAFAFLDLSDDDAIDPDAAVSAMEVLTSYLRNCTPEERQALKDAAAWHLRAEKALKNPRKNVVNFYKTFTKDLFD